MVLYMTTDDVPRHLWSFCHGEDYDTNCVALHFQPLQRLSKLGMVRHASEGLYVMAVPMVVRQCLLKRRSRNSPLLQLLHYVTKGKAHTLAPLEQL